MKEVLKLIGSVRAHANVASITTLFCFVLTAPIWTPIDWQTTYSCSLAHKSRIKPFTCAAMLPVTISGEYTPAQIAMAEWSVRIFLLLVLFFSVRAVRHWLALHQGNYQRALSLTVANVIYQVLSPICCLLYFIVNVYLTIRWGYNFAIRGNSLLLFHHWFGLMRAPAYSVSFKSNYSVAMPLLIIRIWNTPFNIWVTPEQIAVFNGWITTCFCRAS